MPLIDYKDDVTGEIFEVLIRTSNVPEKIQNPDTGNESTRIYSGRVGVEFKGSGFYETDYKNK